MKCSWRDFGHDKQLRALGRSHDVPRHREGSLLHPLEHDINRRSALGTSNAGGPHSSCDNIGGKLVSM